MNSTRQTESPKTILSSSYLIELKPFSPYNRFTEVTENKLSGTSVNFTATSEDIEDRTEITPYIRFTENKVSGTSVDFTATSEDIKDRTEIKPYIRSTEATENKLSGPSEDFTATSEGAKDRTEIDLSPGRKTETSSTCCDVTSTPTPRDTTFRPGSTDARKSNDLWWLMMLPFILAILLIVTAIRVLKKKNRYV
jgi:hypothetical protein